MTKSTVVCQSFLVCESPLTLSSNAATWDLVNKFIRAKTSSETFISLMQLILLDYNMRNQHKNNKSANRFSLSEKRQARLRSFCRGRHHLLLFCYALLIILLAGLLLQQNNGCSFISRSVWSSRFSRQKKNFFYTTACWLCLRQINFDVMGDHVRTCGLRPFHDSTTTRHIRLSTKCADTALCNIMSLFLTCMKWSRRLGRQKKKLVIR